MSLHLGDIVPDFHADTTTGPIQFHTWLGNSWGILFSHPKDYTPVCTTELGAVAKLQPEFDKRNTKVIALSVDGINDHKQWVNDINETQHTSVDFPIIADSDRTIARLYDMLHPNQSETYTVRSVFIIGPDKKLKLSMTYPMSTGRNFAEILRALDALQVNAQHNLATPADWQVGGIAIVPLTVNDADAEAEYGAKLQKVNSYLRLTDIPK